MLLFPLYALFVWFVCWRYRRRVWSFLAVAKGVLGIVTLSIVERRLRHWFGMNDNPFSNLQFLLWGEVIIVGSVGLFIACLPKHRADVPCRKCGYELGGLDEHNPTCPECGLAHAALRVKTRTCRTCKQRVTVDRERMGCTACGAYHVDVEEATESRVGA